METWLPLVLGVGATGLVIFWVAKKVFKLAIYAAIVAAAAWFWFST
ncbi:MAG: hypothetical protein OEY55_04185 [Acidimicrobiia bacterium]|nr:hypothetical protein [Acidimicrobiia bacterium]MDH5504283.1 hypothetical protein [Acidimicrobiia bacterium]